MLRYHISKPSWVLISLTLFTISYIILSPRSHVPTPEADPTPSPGNTINKLVLDNIAPSEEVTGLSSSFLDTLENVDPTSEPVGGVVGLVFGNDGLVKGWDRIQEISTSGMAANQRKAIARMKDRHPIHELVERGRKRWEELLARQSKTLAQAVSTYAQRYGRPPPRGFDVWWKFCQDNNVKIIDDYDQIDRDISPFHAISPATFRRRAEACADAPHSFQINLSPTSKSQTTGIRSGEWRPELLHNLLSPLAPLLPCPLKLYISDHDLGSWILNEDQLSLLRTALHTGTYVPHSALAKVEKPGRSHVKGLIGACAKDSLAYLTALRRVNGVGGSQEVEDQETEFIHDPRQTYDFCNNPSLLNTSGLLSYNIERESTLRPFFVLSKFQRNGELLVTPLDAYDNSTSPEGFKSYTPWESKSISKVFWRGSSTGDNYNQRAGFDWRKSHRPRLHLFANSQQGSSEIWVKRGVKSIEGKKETNGKGGEGGEGSGGWRKETWEDRVLNERYFDIGLTGVHQCDESDGTCGIMRDELKLAERVGPEQAARYKYVLDVDGNGWSPRFHRLLLSGSMVIKSTILPEWYSDWITPWVHYVPAKTDYTDLYTIISFFAGPPDSISKSGGGEDSLAREIAEAGRKFAEDHWRWEDMQAYMLRLLLEYARLQADDRVAWSYI